MHSLISYRLLIGLIIFVCIAADNIHASAARLTVLVYMNAKSRDLDCFSLEDVREMSNAQVPDINVVIELGRLVSPRTCKNDEDTKNVWNGTLFFQLKPGLKAIPKEAIIDPPVPTPNPGNPPHVDMGSPSALRQFVAWAQQRFKAEHYVLVIWGHGRGFRLEQLRSDPSRYRESFAITGFKSFSLDSEFGTFLSVHDVRAALKGMIRFDVIGFDACLMGTIEAAYGLRGRTRLMVASQQLEPLSGWNYEDVLTRFENLESITSTRLGVEIVESFRSTYGDDFETTLSLLNIQQVQKVALHLSHLADEMIKHIVRHEDPILLKHKMLIARLRSANYGAQGGFNSLVDLSHVLIELADQHPKGSLQRKIERTFQEVLSNKVVVDNYASAVVKGDFGSYGLSIFFAKDKADYMKPDSDGYHLSTCRNPEKTPVDFVCDFKWATLISEFVGVRD